MLNGVPATTRPLIARMVTTGSVSGGAGPVGPLPPANGISVLPEAGRSMMVTRHPLQNGHVDSEFAVIGDETQSHFQGFQGPVPAGPRWGSAARCSSHSPPPPRCVAGG